MRILRIIVASGHLASESARLDRNYEMRQVWLVRLAKNLEDPIGGPFKSRHTYLREYHYPYRYRYRVCYLTSLKN